MNEENELKFIIYYEILSKPITNSLITYKGVGFSGTLLHGFKEDEFTVEITGRNSAIITILDND